MKRTYHGEYRSSTAGLTGCTKVFISAGRDVLLFPPQVEYPCDVCGHTHGFRLVTTHQIATPGQARTFASHCSTSGFETEVEVDARRR